MIELKDEHLTRQRDLIPTERLNIPVTIIGAGAIGSWVALGLAKMGMEDITVYDPDKVDTVNLNSQFYPLASVGLTKVGALSDLVRQFTGVDIVAKCDKFEMGMPLGRGIIIAAVDSMAARKSIWDTLVSRPSLNTRFIDPRMGAEQALLYVMNPLDGKDRETYPASLYGDSEALQERCTAKATIYTANLLSGLVCKAVKDYISEEKEYLRVAQWDIRSNQLIAFQRQP